MTQGVPVGPLYWNTCSPRGSRSCDGAAMDFNRNGRHGRRNPSAMAGIDKRNSFRKEMRGRMRKLGQPATILGLLLTMLASATAFGEDMVAIRISA